jgi:phosphoribosylformimino-5-aminoimidazole carboxamide ribotide isomerase
VRVIGGDGSLILYPAIDISEGKAVRLVKGDFNQVTVYEDSPLEAARAWVEAGARFLHVVDLDGARTGSPKSLEHLEQIANELHVPIQYGGGLRSLPAVRDALRAGAERVILGTAAFNDIDFLDDVLGAFRERTIVSVDTRGGNVSTSGWQETTQMPAEAVIERLQNRGVRSFVYTDVDRDGMLGGIDFQNVRRIAQAVRGRFIYSGGIGSLDDLRGLRARRCTKGASRSPRASGRSSPRRPTRSPTGRSQPATEPAARQRRSHQSSYSWARAPQARDPLPRRRRRTRRQGHQLRRAARRG